MGSHVDVILGEYSSKAGLLRRYAEALHLLLGAILQGKGFHPHVITHRLKNEDSLARKIQRPDAEYNALVDVTDVVGLRIITHFASDVDQMAEVIEGEFVIDRANSVDKRKALGPDQFGYLSVHYVVQLSTTRAVLPEHSEFAGLKAEIQVRSILQHAWAENEHDLGYKPAGAVPEPLRRRWARLAGLLELGDAEFDAILKETRSYGAQVDAAMKSNTRRGHEEEDIPLDGLSLAAYARSNPFLLKLEDEMASAAGTRLRDDPGLIEEAVPRLHALGIKTIDALHRALENHHDEILELTKVRMRGFHISRGTEFLFLAYLIVGKKDSVDELVTFFELYEITSPNRRRNLAEAVLGQVRQIRRR
jgi:putative GTP pyrophosphokinase